MAQILGVRVIQDLELWFEVPMFKVPMFTSVGHVGFQAFRALGNLYLKDPKVQNAWVQNATKAGLIRSLNARAKSESDKPKALPTKI